MQSESVYLCGVSVGLERNVKLELYGSTIAAGQAAAEAMSAGARSSDTVARHHPIDGVLSAIALIATGAMTILT